MRRQRRDRGVDVVRDVDVVRRIGIHDDEHRATFHGSRPSSSRSGKIHRLPASDLASTTARPTARWSAWLTGPPGKRSAYVVVTTRSGRRIRISRAMARRSGRPYSTTPSANPSRNSTTSTPTRAAPARSSCLAQRPGLGGRHGVDAGLPAGHEQVGHGLARPRPTCRPRRPCRTRGRRGARRRRGRSRRCSRPVLPARGAPSWTKSRVAWRSLGRM